MLTKIFAIVFMLLLFDLYSVEPKPLKKEYIVVNHPNYNPGMFSVFCTVAGFLDYYEGGDFEGIEINFEDKGLYYDPAYGLNWWSYYCKAIKIGSPKKGKVKRYSSMDECGERALHTEFHLSRERVNELINKYIEFSPRVLAKVSEFTEKNFQGKYIIGVHYRGTDKYSEAPRVPYDGVVYLIQKKIKEAKKGYRIFVASDEQDFIDHLKLKFPARVIYTAAKRSKNGDPIHFTPKSRYLSGEEAIVDALLLSKTDFLIRTSSNLSLWSTYFNPSLPCHLINKRY